MIYVDVFIPMMEILLQDFPLAVVNIEAINLQDWNIMHSFIMAGAFDVIEDE